MSFKSLWDGFTDYYSSLIFHPQFFLKKYNNTAILLAEKYATGTLLDIGCGRMPYKKKLLSNIKQYIGLDSPITAKLYHGENKPDIFADANKIPLSNKSIDTILSLQVLEHLSAPQKSLSEIKRLLKKNGLLILSTVQYYPLHDEPYDFYRYTKYGLINLLKEQDLKIIKFKEEGNVFILIGQSFNIYLMLVLKKLVKTNIGKILALLFLPFFLSITTIVNLITYPLSFFDKNSNFRIIHTVVAKNI